LSAPHKDHGQTKSGDRLSPRRQPRQEADTVLRAAPRNHARVQCQGRDEQAGVLFECSGVILSRVHSTQQRAKLLVDITARPAIRTMSCQLNNSFAELLAFGGAFSNCRTFPLLDPIKLSIPRAVTRSGAPLQRRAIFVFWLSGPAEPRVNIDERWVSYLPAMSEPAAILLSHRGAARGYGCRVLQA
jgi:hypothetical protein